MCTLIPRGRGTQSRERGAVRVGVVHPRAWPSRVVSRRLILCRFHNKIHVLQCFLISQDSHIGSGNSPIDPPCAGGIVEGIGDGWTTNCAWRCPSKACREALRRFAWNVPAGLPQWHEVLAAETEHPRAPAYAWPGRYGKSLHVDPDNTRNHKMHGHSACENAIPTAHSAIWSFNSPRDHHPLPVSSVLPNRSNACAFTSLMDSSTSTKPLIAVFTASLFFRLLPSRAGRR